MICYRCHKRGHFAANCSTRKVGRLKTIEFKPNASLATTSLKNSSSCVIHLLLSKNVDSGLTMEHKNKEVERIMSIEKQPLELLVSGTYNLIRYWNNSTIHRCFIFSVFNNSTSSIMHLILLSSFEKDTGTIEAYNGHQETTSKRSLNLEKTEKLARRDNMHPYSKLRSCFSATKEEEDVDFNNIMLREEPPDALRIAKLQQY